MFLLCAAILGPGGCNSAGKTGLTRFTYAQIHMGSRARIILYAPDEPQARLAARAAYAKIAELDSILSDYRQDSEISRLCAGEMGEVGEWTPISADLFRVLERAEEISALTDGAFDCTIGPLSMLWRQARQQGELPPPARLAEARSRVGWHLVRLDRDTRSAALDADGMRIDFGAIGKGYAADRAVEVLRELGISRCLVDFGGDIAAGDPPPGETVWRIEIETGYGSGVRPVVLAARCGIATSGDIEQAVAIGGQRYSHILDPETGLGLTVPTAATVIAPDAATADALASAVCVLGPERTREIIDNLPGIGVRLVVAGRVFRYGEAVEQIPER
ncbi:FAD:protein FMN transferase [hydrothermal vent metagenome]|uniref:FAD:protein FMN transferase n=1 Tax=hydrothermal vent metagenome TaxID=652676 RepID=A0A3B1E2P9_9ZZZZ